MHIGLTAKEVKQRLLEEGNNELPSSRTHGIVSTVVEVVREPMFLLLVACGTIYLFLGSVEEALMLLSFVFVVMGISVYQQRKTDRALEVLRDLSSPRALVIRQGKELRIAGREVVRDDIIVLKEGDRVPADAILMESTNLLVDESLLTGESVPVRKIAASKNEMAQAHPGGDDLPFVYSSTLVVQGQGIGRVIATGSRTEIGKIGKVLQKVEPEQTLLQKRTGRLVRDMALVGLFLCAVIVIVYGISRHSWLDGLLAGITLAMATLPEEFPVVLTIFLALGAWRISQKQVLTRRVPAVETLGSATVLCVDKTGTLTQNRMTVQKLFADGQFHEVNPATAAFLPETFHQLVEYSILASQLDPFDPMEQAIKHLGDFYLAHTEHLHHDWTLIHQYPLSKTLLALSHVWRSPDGIEYEIAAKGSPETIIDLCHLPEPQIEQLTQHINMLAAAGLRVIGVAKSCFRQTSDLPAGQHDFDFEFLGLVGLADPIRPTVPQALAECYTAGIRVVMITGDYPGTAQNIAQQIGLKTPHLFITGPELERLSDQELQQQVKNINIFARVVPEQKLRIVNAFKANGEIVAMTGDGVNDAPALKSAHIGIAMGGRGTDVARESSALVLLEDDFSSIVEAVKLGRRIFDNIKKAIAYILAIHVPIAGMSLLPVLLGLPLVFLPVHIVFLELIIDPACSIVFEAEAAERNIMCRPPRNPKEPLFNWQTISVSLLQGGSVLAIIFAVFIIARQIGHGDQEARALTYTTLLIANLGLILTNRSWTTTIIRSWRASNPALWWVVSGTLIFLTLALYLPWARIFFKFEYLHLSDLIICLISGIVSILWFEGLKMFKTLT